MTPPQGSSMTTWHYRCGPELLVSPPQKYGPRNLFQGPRRMSNLTVESNILFLSYTQAEREDHEALCPCLVSPLPCNQGVPADDFAQPPRKTQNRGMRDFGDGGETGRERAVENCDGTASEPAGSCTRHLGAHRRGWPLRVEGYRSRALPAEGKPHRFCDPRVWPEDGQ